MCRMESKRGDVYTCMVMMERWDCFCRVSLCFKYVNKVSLHEEKVHPSEDWRASGISVYFVYKAWLDNGPISNSVHKHYLAFSLVRETPQAVVKIKIKGNFLSSSPELQHYCCTEGSWVSSLQILLFFIVGKIMEALSIWTNLFDRICCASWRHF